MRLPFDPKLPVNVDGADWPQRMVLRLSDLWRLLVGVLEEDVFSPGWDDLRFPAQGINPAGAVAPATVDDTTVPGTLLFSGSADNVVAGVAQMPHTWAPTVSDPEYGAGIVLPHIHWARTVGSSSAVSWQLRWMVLGNPGETFGSWKTATGVGSYSSSAANVHQMVNFGEMTLTGYKASVMVAWELKRLGSTDASGDAARLLEFDIHYRTGARSGTFNPIPT